MEPSNSRRGSFYRDMGVSDYMRFAHPDREGSQRNSRLSTAAPTPERQDSIRGGPSTGSQSDDPAERLMDMPARQFVAVLRDVMQQLRMDEDYVALRLLLSDLGQACRSQSSECGSLGLSYSTINEALQSAVSRHPTTEGEYIPPSAWKRLWRWCGGGGGG